jgi:hypothetical protein
MKWEYLQIMMTTKPVKEGHSRMIVLSQGKEQAPVAAGKRMIDLLCDLGAEGWELTTTLDISSHEESKNNHDLNLKNSSLLLKRPLSSS